jgi:fructose-1-phosphate kinase PfkB-like protein
VRSRIPRLTISVEVLVNKKKSEITFQGSPAQQQEFQQIMDQYQKIVGDGKARVGVSTDFGTKEYGNGVSVMVSVSLTCNQDQQTMMVAMDLAGQMARYYAKEHSKLGQAEYQNLKLETGQR